MADMRQVLLNSSGAVVARMPRPALTPGTVLVRTRYSLISAGTELAALAPPPPDSGLGSRPEVALSAARALLGKAIADPRKAGRRVATLVTDRVRAALPATARLPTTVVFDDLIWQTCGRATCRSTSGAVEVVTDADTGAYQVMSQALAVPEGHVPVLEFSGVAAGGRASIGLLDAARAGWLGTAMVGPGPFEERLVWDPKGSAEVTVVLANAGDAGVRVTLDRARVEVVPADGDTGALDELDQQGWNVGYSLAGEVVAVGAGVTDLAPGDRVACAGAGDANHADFVCVPRNLVCPVPDECQLTDAATTTVGAIALQGVRRAGPQLGEHVCVLGLGLIGQITMQLLRAAGCRVTGMDLDSGRVDRAIALGMDAGCTDPAELVRIVADATSGHGSDRTLITAAARSDDLINLAMEVTRAKGTVVIVGDVGLGVKRPAFYRKEIDLLMSTSYGPGRYDARYEREGLDYPYGYVRWTLNRNMASYLDLVKSGRVNVAALIDRVADVGEAHEVYRSLTGQDANKPLGVLLAYPDAGPLAEAGTGASTRIAIRGARPARPGPARYALVGAGGFAIGMLLPQMKKLPDRFALGAVVSSDTTRGGNLARNERAPVFTTELEQVLDDPAIDLVVIATRHLLHAPQVAASLAAGKHVFVEKPLAITWDQLDQVLTAHQTAPGDPIVMVGFNRRFSPALLALAAELTARRNPLVVNYRVNAGYLPPDHWVQGAEGGGRNLGEACHMYDVFRFLTGVPAASVVATSISPTAGRYLRNDNFSATIGYQDGSVANLVYTSLGPREGLAKERIEVFCDGQAWIVDDFRNLTRAGDGRVLWESTTTDKGHLEELSRMGEAIAAGSGLPVPFRDLAETSALALHIEDLLYGGDG